MGRQINQHNLLIHCDCGHIVPQSEMANCFMGKSTSRNICNSCYDEWVNEIEEKKETIDEIFRNAFNDFL